MSDAPVIDFLRIQFARLNERMDTSDGKQEEMIGRLGSVERGLASVRGDLADLRGDVVGLQIRLDNIDRRLTRVERRLDLAELPA